MKEKRGIDERGKRSEEDKGGEVKERGGFEEKNLPCEFMENRIKSHYNTLLFYTN